MHVCSPPLSIATFDALMAMGPFAAIRKASCTACSVALLPSGTTSVTSPYSFASFPFSFLPVQMSSLARDAPINRGSLCVPPAPGMIASEVSGSPRTAFVEAIRMSAARANSRPPPTATPSMAATTGMGRDANLSIVFRSKATKSAVSSSVMVARSFRSAPAENTLSEHEVRTRHRQLVLALAPSCVLLSSVSLLPLPLP
mmetsp:Transcript_2256/g.4833  ORF Transcript_2256/g.4833 Transcript_2256/m.4833 type:complete len:200 (+) Transcript_2256:307-906(+)